MDNWFIEKYQKGIGVSLKGTRKLLSLQSKFQKIEVIQTHSFGNLLLLDDMVMCTEKDEFVYHEMISHIPAMAHPQPKTALIIGGGDGGTIRELVKHPSLTKIVLCEIDPDVVATAKAFFPSLACCFKHPKVEVLIQDGIKLVAETPANTYDLICIDSSEPIGPGIGLFTNAFYLNLLRILTPYGIMTAQTEAPFVCQDMIQAIYRKLNTIFPVVNMYTAPIPTYPSGFWSFAFCSKFYYPTENLERKSFSEIERLTHYYNKEIHQAAFILPNFIRAIMR